MPGANWLGIPAKFGLRPYPYPPAFPNASPPPPGPIPYPIPPLFIIASGGRFTPSENGSTFGAGAPVGCGFIVPPGTGPLLGEVEFITLGLGLCFVADEFPLGSMLLFILSELPLYGNSFSTLKLFTLGPLPANAGLFDSTSSPLEPELGVGRDVLSLLTFPTSDVAIARNTGPKIPPCSSREEAL